MLFYDSYEALSGGRAKEALAVLTGWPAKEHSLDVGEEELQMLWSQLQTSRDRGFLITVSSSNDRAGCETAGLRPDHCYQVMIDITGKG